MYWRINTKCAFMKTLTQAEEEIMQLLWRLNAANVAQLIDAMEEPKPAYNTVSTIVRILVDKEFADYRKKGRGHIYFPVVSKESYTQFTLSKVKNKYFEGSLKNMVSFFIKKKDLSIDDLEDIMNEINKNQES